MTLHERLLLLRAINSRNIPNANDQIPAASAAVDARAVELYKLIARADRGAWQREQALRLARRVLESRTSTT
jgi:hypothetical protein